VQLNHGYAARNGFRSVDLNFVIVLGANRDCGAANDQKRGDQEIRAGAQNDPPRLSALTSARILQQTAVFERQRLLKVG